MFDRIMTVVFGGALAIGLSAGVVAIAVTSIHVEPVPAHVMPRCTDEIADAGGICKGEPLPACRTEDSDNCYWNAATMGNGSGRSFVVEHGDVTYTD